MESSRLLSAVFARIPLREMSSSPLSSTSTALTLFPPRESATEAAPPWPRFFRGQRAPSQRLTGPPYLGRVLGRRFGGGGGGGGAGGV
eukprot:9477983-Pyramimonas_sp.AAC.1